MRTYIRTLFHHFLRQSYDMHLSVTIPLVSFLLSVLFITHAKHIIHMGGLFVHFLAKCIRDKAQKIWGKWRHKNRENSSASSLLVLFLPGDPEMTLEAYTSKLFASDVDVHLYMYYKASSCKHVYTHGEHPYRVLKSRLVT